jgi:hypothetical protein
MGCQKLTGFVRESQYAIYMPFYKSTSRLQGGRCVWV